MISNTANDVLELLNDDMVSHGLLLQCVQLAKIDNSVVAAVIEELLESGKVEIGTARLATPEHVEFIAWKGTAKERIARTMEALEHTDRSSQEFAYWLCLRRNVDRFEREESP